ncbi:MAG TPA: hypothetical protein VJP77_05835 [Planctomycetota bacterium]|nr:hypothetical protein [Planctomycetota bacterium]
MKLKLVRPKMAADFRARDDNPNRCHGTHLCPQHDGLKKWRADNERLGLSHLSAWYDSHAIPCGPMKRS